MIWLVLLGILVVLLLAGRGLAMPYIGTSVVSPDKVRNMATGIAQAEGWFVPGSLPQRSNNPGALRLYGELDTITTFPSPDAGWQALYRQVERILSGESPYYSLDMTLWQVAEQYTGGDNPSGWAVVVAAAMGISPNTTLREYMGY